MVLLKVFCTIFILFFLYYRIGVLLKKIINSKFKDISTTLIYGFIFNFAIFEIINLPFIFINQTKILYYIFLIMNSLLVLLSYIIKYSVKIYNLKENVKLINKKSIIFYIITIFIISFQIFNSSFLFKQDADDSFYISLANEARELEDLHTTDPSTGLENTKFDKKYIFNTWEIYGGFIARTMNINVDTLFHTAYQFIFIFLAYISYNLVIKKCISKKENAGLAILVLSIIFLFTSVSVKFKGPFLLGRIYQGKSILLNIIIPFIISNFLEYEKFDKNNYIILVLIYISALSFSPITIWLVSIIYGVFILMILLKKDFKNFAKSLTLIIPIIIIGLLYIFVSVLGNNDLISITNSESFEQLDDFKMFIGNGKTILILYIISIFIIWIKGNEIQKRLCVYFPILLLIFVYNPLLTKIYVKVVTSATYWRLYWLLPIELSIAISSVIIYNNLLYKKDKIIYLLFVTSLIVISGKYAYTKEMGFSKFENFEKIPKYIIDETHYISESSNKKVKVVAPSEPWESCMMRQYSTNILLMHSRNMMSSNGYNELYNKLYYSEGNEYDLKNIELMFNKFSIDYIIIPKNKQLNLQENEYLKVCTENEKNYIIGKK